nr:hypothetical protein [Deinococcus hopiensis]
MSRCERWKVTNTTGNGDTRVGPKDLRNLCKSWATSVREYCRETFGGESACGLPGIVTPRIKGSVGPEAFHERRTIRT